MEMNEKELLALVAAKLGTGPPPPLAPSLPIKMAPPSKIEERKGPHPIDSVPVAGTPWSVVFTSDRKQFFFDATSRKSYWKLPPELIHNPLVLKILEAPPWKKREPPCDINSIQIMYNTVHVVIHVHVHVQCSLYIMDTLIQESCSVIQRCPLCGSYFIQ